MKTLKKVLLTSILCLLMIPCSLFAKGDIRTIGDSKKGERIKIVNKAGSGIQAFYIASEQDDAFVNDLLENERTIKRNETVNICFVADPSLTYDAKIQIRNIEYVLHDFPIGDAKSIEIYLDDSAGIAYIEYQSTETGETINTYDIEVNLLKEEQGDTQEIPTEIYDPYGTYAIPDQQPEETEEQTELAPEQEQDYNEMDDSETDSNYMY